MSGQIKYTWFPKPRRVLLKANGVFDPVDLEGKILGEYTHGFNLPSGAWALFGDPVKGDEPAAYWCFLPKGRRTRWYRIDKKDVLEMKDL